MATASPFSDPSLDIGEQIARIDKMQAELGKVQVEITRITVDTDKTRLDVRLAPWTAAFTGLGAGAAEFAAGAAFAKLLLS